MGNSNRSSRRKQKQEQRLRVRSIRRNPPDLSKLAGALIELAQAQAEADAEAEEVRRKAAKRARVAKRDGQDEDDAGGDAA